MCNKCSWLSFLKSISQDGGGGGGGDGEMELNGRIKIRGDICGGGRGIEFHASINRARMHNNNNNILSIGTERSEALVCYFFFCLRK